MSKSVANHDVLRAGAFVFGVNVIDKSIGFIRTLILARILLPEYFGIIGICWLTISTLETLTQTGIDTAVMYRQENIAEYLSTAWLIQIARGCLLYAILFAAAPFLESLFATPGITHLLRIIGVTVLLSSVTNTGMMLYYKEMNFRHPAILQLVSGFMEFAVSLLIAVAFKTLWALVVGHFAGVIVRVAGSFAIQPYRPAFQFSPTKARDLLTYGKWVTLSTILIFLLTSGDDAFVAMYLGPTSLAFYQMAYRISNMPATEITHVISQVTVPAYCSMQNDLVALRRTFRSAVQLTAALTLPLSVVIYTIMPTLTQSILGEKWNPIVLPGQILCIFGATRSIGASMGPILTSTGRQDIQSKLSLIQLVFMVIIIYPLTSRLGIVGTSIAVVLPNIFALVVMGWVVKDILQTSAAYLLRTLSGPLLGGLAMVMLSLFGPYAEYESTNSIHVVMNIVLSMVAYIIVLIIWDKRQGATLWNDVKILATSSSRIS